MYDGIEVILATLAVVMGGAAFAVGGHVIAEAWRGASTKALATRAAERPVRGQAGLPAAPAPSDTAPRRPAVESRS
jgi:hypothetical protein